MTPARQPDILVLCPMEIERKAVAAEVLAAGLEHVAIVRTGIGKIAIVEHVQRAAAMAARPRLVILAGACGALRPVEDVPPVGRVIDEHGGEWVGLGMAPAGRTVVGVDRIVATPLEKRELADRTGAVIVDMESHAFSAACEGLGLSWTIVRGVSDSPEESLPKEVLGWVNADGTTRNRRAALDMALKPWLVPHIAAVMKRSNRVLPLVGKRVVEIARSMEDRGRTVDS